MAADDLVQQTGGRQTTTAPGGPERPRVRLGYQPALDGMRGIGAIAVLAFHGGVTWVRGGFLSVDMFFVLSGFLITSLLLAEHYNHGRIRFAAFWARRGRRLLPALFAVLAAVAIAGPWLLPSTELPLLRADTLGALGYVANWRLIYRGDGYFEQTANPSPLQHTWSLGIEEQFYLLWPLLLALILLLARWRRALLVLCAVGTVVSAIVAALLYRPEDVNRAYFGTDTRAAALLIGCGLAALIGMTVLRGDQLPRRPRRVLGGFALVAAVFLVWAWLRAEGTAAYMYRGGFPVIEIAVAVVLAHAVLSPRSPTARVLHVPPLVWLGKISYGVYLWHWPLFLTLTADRTGLDGTALLALRVGVTLVVATLSYYLLEQPIRTGKAFRAPKAAPAVALAGIAVVAMLATTITLVPRGSVDAGDRSPADGPPLALPSGLPRATSPMQRPGRRPGTLPRITIFGDSVAWNIGAYLPKQPSMQIANRGIQGCGIAPLHDIRYIGFLHRPYQNCDKWDQRWTRDMNADDPDVSVILLNRWELIDAKLNGRWTNIGQPDYDAFLRRQLTRAMSIANRRGATIVLLTAMYTRRMERPDGGLFPEDMPERVDAWNRLLHSVAASDPERIRVLNLNRVLCPDGEFTWKVDGVRVRTDGAHLTPAAVKRFVAPWLLPQLARIATGRS